MWIRQPSQSQPYIKLTVQAHEDDYKALGVTLHSRPKPATMHIMADTGCQSCLAGVKIIYKLGLKHSDLIPVTMKMEAANKKGINILGAAVLRLSGRDTKNNHIETRQLTYITDSSDKFYISKEACMYNFREIPNSWRS